MSSFSFLTKMSSVALFMKRLLIEWKFQSRVWGSILDWTVILYILIPGLVIFGYHYRSWWNEPPNWMQSVPFVFIAVISYLLAWRGQYRTFIHEADKVFLIKRLALFLGLKRISYVYSLFTTLLLYGVITFLFLPVLIQSYKLLNIQIFLFALLLTSIKWFIMGLKPKIMKIDGKVLRSLTRGFTFVIGSWMVQFLCIQILKTAYLLPVLACLLFTGIAFVLYMPSLFKVSTFEEEWLSEQKERQRLIGAIITIAPEVEKRSTSTRTKPWVLRKSKRIYKKRNPENGFKELFIKVFIRNANYWGGYLQIVSITSAALLLVPPLWIKVIIGVAFIFMLNSWLMSVWDQTIISYPLTKKYQERDEFFNARKKLVGTLTVLGILFVAFFYWIGSQLYFYFSI